MAIRLRLAGLAALFALGGVSAAYAQQDAAAEAACAGGDGAACLGLGEATYLGTYGGPADVSQALNYFMQACALRNGPACFRLGAELEFPDFGAPKAEAALAAYTTACGLGVEEGCARAGMKVPVAETADAEPASEPDTDLPAPDNPMAEEDSAREAAVVVTAFAAPTEDETLAASGPSFAEEALPDLEFGAAIAGPDTLPDAETLAAESAEGSVAGPNVDAETPPSEEDLALAAERQEMADACGRSDLEACEIFAAWLRDGTGGEADAVRARRIFSVICTEGSVKGCYELAWMMYDGAQVGDADGRGELELSRARFLFSDTCKAGVAEACLQAGDMRRHGEGGPLDLTGAARFYGIACAAGIEPGCTMAADVTPAEETVDPSADAAATEQDSLPADGAAPEDLAPADDEPVTG